MKKELPFLAFLILISSLPIELNSQVKDIDGNIYKTIKIGEQLWTAENIKTSRLNDGSKIQMVEGNDEFINMKTPAFSWYNNDTLFKRIYGGLYNWYSVKTGKLCPSGWHVPSDVEWMTLEKSLGMSEEDATNIGDRGTDQGARLKSSTRWGDDKIINSVGFAALPAGLRGDDGSFMSANDNSFRSSFYADFWSSTPNVKKSLPDSQNSYYRSLHSRENTILRIACNNGRAHSIRCVKD